MSFKKEKLSCERQEIIDTYTEQHTAHDKILKLMMEEINYQYERYDEIMARNLMYYNFLKDKPELIRQFVIFAYNEVDNGRCTKEQLLKEITIFDDCGDFELNSMQCAKEDFKPWNEE